MMPHVAAMESVGVSGWRFANESPPSFQISGLWSGSHGTGNRSVAGAPPAGEFAARTSTNKCRRFRSGVIQPGASLKAPLVAPIRPSNSATEFVLPSRCRLSGDTLPSV